MAFGKTAFGRTETVFEKRAFGYRRGNHGKELAGTDSVVRASKGCVTIGGVVVFCNIWLVFQPVGN